MYHQAWYLIAHGNLDPGNSFGIGTYTYPFWRDHSEFIMWPLALFYWIPPHDLKLLWLQDAGVVVAQALAFTWICELAQKYRPGRKDAAVLAGAGLILLVGNPWTWTAISYDFHTETVAVVFLVLLIRDLFNGRRRAWVWVAPLLACGDVTYVYLVAVGLAAILAARRTRLTGLAMVVVGLVALQVVHLVHGDLNDPFAGYAYLQQPRNAPFSLLALLRGIVGNPRLVVRQLWYNRWPTWQNLSASGLLGVAFIWVLPVIAAVLLANNLLVGNVFAAAGFQSMPLYILVPVGTVVVLGWLARRERLLAMAVAVVVLAQALYWTAVYGPRTKEDWLRVPAPTAAALAKVQPRIPASDQVIVSQGEVGPFSGRAHVDAYYGPGTIAISDITTFFVIVPDQGILTYTPQDAMEAIHQVAHLHGATLVLHENGVWAYKWTPPPGTHQIDLQ